MDYTHLFLKSIYMNLANHVAVYLAEFVYAQPAPYVKPSLK